MIGRIAAVVGMGIGQDLLLQIGFVAVVVVGTGKDIVMSEEQRHY